MSVRVTLTIAAFGLALMQGPVLADSMRTTTCFGTWTGGSCVRLYGNGVNPNIRAVAEAKSDQDKAESAQRERLWVARCRPRMTVDEMGVQRYAYAAAGCEFGKYQ